MKCNVYWLFLSAMSTLTSCRHEPTNSLSLNATSIEKNQPLKVYDACESQWITPQLTLTAEEIEAKPRIVEKSQWIDRSYKINGTWMRLFNVDIYHLNEHMKPGKDPIPKSLRGIWWMDGNPLPEVVLSFADAKVEDGKIKNYYNGPNSYVFSATAKGRLNWDVTNFFKTGMVFRPTPSLDFQNPKKGDMFYVDVDARFVGSIVSENMPTLYVGDGHWMRKTAIGKKVEKAGEHTIEQPNFHCYNLRRIVDENGRRLPIYPYFVQEVLKKNQAAGSKVPEVVMQIRPTP